MSENKGLERWITNLFKELDEFVSLLGLQDVKIKATVFEDDVKTGHVRCWQAPEVSRVVTMEINWKWLVSHMPAL